MRVKRTIVIVGGTYGGPSAAAKARLANEHAHIIMIEQGPFLSWSHFSLRQHLSGNESLVKDKLIELDKLFGQRFDVEIRRDTRALSIDVDSRILVIDWQRARERLPYDALIFAPRAECRTLDVNGLFGPRVVNFHNHDDIIAIKSAIAEGARTAAVVGLGICGVDAALGLREQGLDVTVIENKQRIMPRFSLQFTHAMRKKLVDKGLSIKLGVAVVDAIQHPHGSMTLRLSNDEIIDADLVIEAIGIKPKNALLENAGAAVDVDGLIRVDDHMRTTLPNVFACGSAVSVPCAVTGDRRFVPEPAIIQRTAQVAGFNAACDNSLNLDSIKPVSGSLMVAIDDMFFARTGLSEEEAREFLGDDNLFVTTVFGTTALSLVYQSEMCVKLIVDRNSRRIVGGEVYGKSGVERSIDLLSVAVLEGFSPDRLIDIDLAYLTDASPAFDPLKDAAVRARMGLFDNTRIMSAETLALWVKNNRDFRLVDVGEAPKLSGRMASKALHLPLEALRNRMDELAKVDSPIVLYSKSGHRSYLAQQALLQRGMTNVYHLDGGLASLDLIAKE